MTKDRYQRHALLAAQCEAYARKVRAYANAIVDREAARQRNQLSRTHDLTARAKRHASELEPMIHVIAARIRDLDNNS